MALLKNMEIVYLIIAILLIVGLVAVFFISYHYNKKTPVPPGCESLEISDENCSHCGNLDCNIKKSLNHKLEEISDELKEEEEK